MSNKNNSKQNDSSKGVKVDVKVTDVKKIRINETKEHSSKKPLLKEDKK